MMNSQICVIGTESETAHHVAPLLERMPVRILPPEVALRELQPGDLAIFYSEHFDRFRHSCVELKRRQVATLYLLDGILEWRNAWENRPEEPACPWTMRTILSHKAACIGPSQFRMLNHWGNAGKTEVVGIPRLEQQRRKYRAGSGSLWTASPSPCEPRRPLRLMVATAKTPGFTEAQMAITRQMLADAQRFFARAGERPDESIEVIWRVAPELADELGLVSCLSDWTGGELNQQLQNVDAVLTTPSTLMLEAALVGRPVALLNYHQAPSLVPAAWQITHADQWPAVISELRSPPPAKENYQDYWLRDAMQCECDSVERLTQLIEAMQREAHNCRDANQPLVFSPNLLPPIPEIHGTLDLPRLFPQFSEWGFDSADQLAAELAQTRREIRHLQGELDQARKELGEAHRIFENIQRHPIAGPIVRIRQTLLDWLDTKPKGKETVENGAQTSSAHRDSPIR